MQHQYLEEKSISHLFSGKGYSPLRLLYIRAGCVCLVAARTPASAGESVHSYQASSFFTASSPQTLCLAINHTSMRSTLFPSVLPKPFGTWRCIGLLRTAEADLSRWLVSVGSCRTKPLVSLVFCRNEMRNQCLFVPLWVFWRVARACSGGLLSRFVQYIGCFIFNSVSVVIGYLFVHAYFWCSSIVYYHPTLLWCLHSLLKCLNDCLIFWNDN